ncbi:MAG: hypothetical protein RMK21_06190 [Aquificaceae bacterium]|nr:hypothetical protein [Aquificaceae bacterium]
MIKINLARVKKEKAKKALDLTALKGLDVSALLKAGGEYYAGIAFWLLLIPLFGYYWKINEERKSLKSELERLNAEKTRLQAEANKFLQERKALEESIASLKKSIQEVENSKDIILGLKAYYDTFGAGLNFYSSQVPRTAWINSYRQSLDMSKQVLSAVLEISALDYASLASYGRALETKPGKVSLTQLERKTTPHGFEYYTAKLNAELQILEGR